MDGAQGPPAFRVAPNQIQPMLHARPHPIIFQRDVDEFHRAQHRGRMAATGRQQLRQANIAENGIGIDSK
jgi:hypothetical protein